MTTPRIVLIGAVESTAVALRAMCNTGVPPALAVSLPLDRNAAHSDFVDLGPLCAEHGIPLLREADVNSEAALARVAQVEPDYIFVIGWSRLVDETFRGLAKRGVIGYHPTLLPAMRGRAALAWTILLNVRETGGTLFWIDDGVDTGPIAVQTRFPIETDIYLGDLLDRQMAALAPMVAELVQKLRDGKEPRHEQDHSHATYLAIRRADDGRIDWNQNADDIARLVRAVARPYPGAFSHLGGRRVTIWRARSERHPEWHALTGQIFTYDQGMPIVRCGDGGSLVIEEYEIAQDDNQGSARLTGQRRFRDA